MRDAALPHPYRIRVQGQLDPSWAEPLGELNLVWDRRGDTELHAHRLDQAALHGLLGRLYALGLTLLSVSRLDERDCVT